MALTRTLDFLYVVTAEAHGYVGVCRRFEGCYTVKIRLKIQTSLVESAISHAKGRSNVLIPANSHRVRLRFPFPFDLY